MLRYQVPRCPGPAWPSGSRTPCPLGQGRNQRGLDLLLAKHCIEVGIGVEKVHELKNGNGLLPTGGKILGLFDVKVIGMVIEE